MDENLLLSLIENNAKMEVVDLAAALNETEENVDKTIKDLEKNKTIYGYHTLILPKIPLHNNRLHLSGLKSQLSLSGCCFLYFHLPERPPRPH